MNTEGKYEAIPVQVDRELPSQVGSSHTRPFLKRMSFGLRPVLCLAAVALIAMVTLRHVDVGRFHWTRTFVSSRGNIIPGDLTDICRELDGGFSYGCWNSGAADTDLCKICRAMDYRMLKPNLRGVTSGKLGATSGKLGATSSKQVVNAAKVNDRGTESFNSIRGVLLDMCRELDGGFSYGCWNSGAGDTDLCKICRAMHMLEPNLRGVTSGRLSATSSKQVVNAAKVNDRGIESFNSIRGVLLDMCRELDGGFSYGCWNSDAGDTDLCKICRAMHMLEPNLRGVTSGRLSATSSKQVVNAAKVNDRGIESFNSIRGVLLDMCRELDGGFSYGCWNSDAGDTDLCKICRAMHMLEPNLRGVTSGKLGATSSK
ncbi:hypothetical protein BWQ96_04280 [Gracilariopsis chorda]|uniref:Uncharacterized protein n=1 Tax=Gracilariopsis chorda TaxID=448386 RepID=A0A2V3IW73_9FLOR|nr:hypothetical protein BWQ96_04280 [Gracilariopsis chorda]|eukprot:PXF45967.1 hypothetical protein BWQ96_04280 [Gracilariopsis chorda]